MMVERVLRAAADEVRATVVRDAVPPPLGDLDRGSPSWVKLAAAAILVVGSAGLALVLATSDPTGPVELSDAPNLSIGAPTVADVCTDIGAVVGALAEPTDDAAPEHLGEHVDRLRAAARHLADLTPSAEVQRRFDRFVAIAGLAVTTRASGPTSTTDEHSWQAVALGEALLSEEPFDVCRPSGDTTIDQGG